MNCTIPTFKTESLQYFHKEKILYKFTQYILTNIYKITPILHKFFYNIQNRDQFQGISEV